MPRESPQLHPICARPLFRQDGPELSKGRRTIGRGGGGLNGEGFNVFLGKDGCRKTVEPGPPPPPLETSDQRPPTGPGGGERRGKMKVKGFRVREEGGEGRGGRGEGVEGVWVLGEMTAERKLLRGCLLEMPPCTVHSVNIRPTPRAGQPSFDPDRIGRHHETRGCPAARNGRSLWSRRSRGST